MISGEGAPSMPLYYSLSPPSPKPDASFRTKTTVISTFYFEFSTLQSRFLIFVMMTFDAAWKISVSSLKSSSWPTMREKWDLALDMIFLPIHEIISSASFLNAPNGFLGESLAPFRDGAAISLSRKGCAAIHNANGLPHHLLIAKIKSKLTVLRVDLDSVPFVNSLHAIKFLSISSFSKKNSYTINRRQSSSNSVSTIPSLPLDIKSRLKQSQISMILSCFTIIFHLENEVSNLSMSLPPRNRCVEE